jgi:plasmid stabilization system protein ParE
MWRPKPRCATTDRYGSRVKKGIERCRRFLFAKNKQAERAGQAIADHLELLEEHPEIGRPFLDGPESKSTLDGTRAQFNPLAGVNGA